MRPLIRAALAAAALAMPSLLGAQAASSAVTAPAAAALTEADAIALALKGSEAVRLRELALQKARLAVDEARSAALPRVDLQASASYLVNPPQGYTVKAGELGTFSPKIPANALGPGSPAIPLGDFSIPSGDFSIGSQQHDYLSLTATLAQPLFTWGKISGAINLAGLAADAAGTDLAAQRRDIRREVSRAWDGALLADSSLAILRRLRETQQGIVDDRQKSLDDGTSNREAVLQARADLAQVDARLSGAEEARETSLTSLAILTGLDRDALVLASSWDDAAPELDEKALAAAAAVVSTDLAAARTRLAQARAKLRVEQGGAMLLPDVSLGVQATVSGQQDLPYKDWSWDAGAWSWDVVVSLGVKLSAFDGLASYSRIAQSDRDAAAAAAAVAQEE